jgi:hypothetical protein
LETLRDLFALLLSSSRGWLPANPTAEQLCCAVCETLRTVAHPLPEKAPQYWLAATERSLADEHPLAPFMPEEKAFLLRLQGSLATAQQTGPWANFFAVVAWLEQLLRGLQEPTVPRLALQAPNAGNLASAVSPLAPSAFPAPVAEGALFKLVLCSLTAYLRSRLANASGDQIYDAVTQALSDFFKRPRVLKPSHEGALVRFLETSTTRLLLKARGKDTRRQARETAWANDSAANCANATPRQASTNGPWAPQVPDDEAMVSDEPSPFDVLVQKENTALCTESLRRLKQRLSPQDWEFRKLREAGERNPQVLGEVLGAGDLPRTEQARRIEQARSRVRQTEHRLMQEFADGDKS